MALLNANFQLPHSDNPNTPQVMWREGGKDQGGQLYVTDRSLAFHGTFGRGTQVLKLDQVWVTAHPSPPVRPSESDG